MSFTVADISDLAYIKKISLDVSGGTTQRYITAKEDDIYSRYLEITVTQDSKTKTIPSGTTAMLRGTKANGSVVLADAEIENGKVFVDLSPIITSPGRARCDVALYDADGHISTVTFFVEVEEKPFNEERVTESDDFSALETALLKVENVDEIADEALRKSEEALDNVEELEAAEQERVAAENARVSAENTRAINETARQTAETQRQTGYQNFRDKIEDALLTGALLTIGMRQFRWDFDSYSAEEVGTVTLTNSLKFPMNNSNVSVALTIPRNTSNYVVNTEVLSAVGNVGEIEITEKLINGFKMSFTGGATSVTVKFIITGGNLL